MSRTVECNKILYCYEHIYASFIYLSLAAERWKRREFLSLVFVSKETNIFC